MSDYWLRMDSVKLDSVKISRVQAPPPPCDPYWGEVTFLLSGNGTLGSTTVIDNGPLNLPFTTEWGTWTYTDAQSKYYPTSLLGSPTGALSTTIPAGPVNESWTWESWIYVPNAILSNTGSGLSFLTNFDVSWALMSHGPSNNGNNQFGLVFLFSNTWYAETPPLVADTWTYLTMTYEKTGAPPGILRSFVNGVLTSTYNGGASIPVWDGQKVWIGPTANSFFTQNGYYFSDCRFTRGVARYTSTFTPPPGPPPLVPCP